MKSLFSWKIQKLNSCYFEYFIIIILTKNHTLFRKSSRKLNCTYSEKLATLFPSTLGFGKTKRKRVVLVTLTDSRWRSAKEQPNWSMPNCSQKIMRILRTIPSSNTVLPPNFSLSFFLLPPSQSLCLTDCQNVSWSYLRVSELGQ